LMAKDRFKIPLTCPKCGKTAIADAWENDGWAYMRGKRDTHIENVPEGFKVVKRKSRMATVDLFCTECDISAIK